jgi:hypothetical protein
MSKDRHMNVKVDADLARKAKVVAAIKNITLTKYITELVRPHIESDLASVAMDLVEPTIASCSPPATARQEEADRFRARPRVTGLSTARF